MQVVVKINKDCINWHNYAEANELKCQNLALPGLIENTEHEQENVEGATTPLR